MADDSEAMGAIILTGLAGFLGYQAGRSKTAHWEAMNKQSDNNIILAAGYKIMKPFGFIYINGESAERLYREAVLSFVFGLDNSSVSTSLRCLEIGLKTKYNEIEKNKPPENLAQLIDWSEKYLGNKKAIAHGFRLLRNLIHTDIMIKQQDALETLRHISEILNLLYPFTSVTKDIKCNKCGFMNRYSVPSENLTLYNNFSERCISCRQPGTITVIG